MITKVVASELLVQDLPTATAFYRDTLGLQVADSNPENTMFKICDLYFFLLDATSAARMIGDTSLDLTHGASRSLHAVSVDDVDAMYADLKARGVRMLAAPADQSWGLRTAYFADPEGNYWEIHQPVASKTAE